MYLHIALVLLGLLAWDLARVRVLEGFEGLGSGPELQAGAPFRS